MNFDDINEAGLRRRRGEKWNHYPADVLPAWVADMDFVVAEPIRAALAGRLEAADLGYPQSHRRTGLPELFAERVAARFDWSIAAADVLILSDVVQGLYLALESYSERGDGVVIQTPIYPPFLHAVAETGRRAVCCDLQPGATRYEIDFATMEAAIDSGCRVFMLCNPHNPSGRAFTADELGRIADLVCRHDLVLVSDEIHADLILAPARHIPVASLSDDIAARTVTLMSASKAFNIAGLCMAFAHFGSPALRRRFERIPAHLRGGTNTLSIAAVEAAWRHGQPWLDEVLATLRANRDRVAEFVAARWPAVGHLPPEATYLAWLDLRKLELEPSPQAWLLEHARVALNEGRTFGPAGEGHVRLNFATSSALLETLLERLDGALSNAHS
ncbi:MAG: MalY/PatB family protein [Gammaproteobacteria bacterium]